MGLRHHINRMLLTAKGGGVLKHRAEIDSVLAMSPDERSRWRNDRIRELIDHWLSVPAYRKFCRPDLVAADVTGAEAMSLLPTISKAALRDGFDAWRANSPDAAVNSTSGSTGQNLVFLQNTSMREANSGAVHWAYGLADVDYWGDRRLIIWGHSPGLGQRQRALDRLKVFMLNARVLQAYGLNDDLCDDYIRILSAWKPFVVEGYPTYLHQLARRGLHRGLRLASPPRAVICSGEQLTSDQKSDIEAWFDTPISNRYGSREFGVIAQTRPGSDCGLVPPTRFFVESDENGELLVTDLQNFATPFIRYRTGDIGHVEPNLEPGVAQYVTDLEGRVHERIETPGGQLIPGQYWTLLSRSVPGITEFQVRQRLDGTVELLVLDDAPLSRSAVSDLENSVRSQYPDLASFKVVRVEQLQRTSLGKRRFIIRERNHDS